MQRCLRSAPLSLSSLAGWIGPDARVTDAASCNVAFALWASAIAHSVTSTANTGPMRTTDDGLDALSRKLLNEADELKRLELEKRRTARGSEEFRDLAAKVDNAARHVFESASGELIDGQQDSPLQDEREEHYPGDWTEGSRN